MANEADGTQFDKGLRRLQELICNTEQRGKQRRSHTYVMLRRELGPLLDAAHSCSTGPHIQGDCDEECTLENCRFVKLQTELDKWRK